MYLYICRVCIAKSEKKNCFLVRFWVKKKARATIIRLVSFHLTHFSHCFKTMRDDFETGGRPKWNGRPGKGEFSTQKKKSFFLFVKIWVGKCYAALSGRWLGWGGRKGVFRSKVRWRAGWLQQSFFPPSMDFTFDFTSAQGRKRMLSSGKTHPIKTGLWLINSLQPSLLCSYWGIGSTALGSGLWL